jgi:hypothetical protein
MILAAFILTVFSLAKTAAWHTKVLECAIITHIFRQRFLLKAFPGKGGEREPSIKLPGPATLKKRESGNLEE